MCLASTRFRKGDIVMVDEDGKAIKYEILSVLTSNKGTKSLMDSCYEARNVITGDKKTISTEDILRLATPVDSSAELFSKRGETGKSKAT